MSAGLKPCPFCGEKTCLWTDEISPKVWAICCSTCKAIGPESEFGWEWAAIKWNVRPGEHAAVQSVLDQALNSGDGAYRP